MRILGILDPLQGPDGPYNLRKDASHLLLWEFHRRGHDVFVADPAGLGTEANKVFVRACRAQVLEGAPYFELFDPALRPATDFKLILMRKDPPVDAAYLQAIQILSGIPSSTWVCNPPKALALWNEKLVVLNFPRWIPPTIVTSSPNTLETFAQANGGRIVLKSLIGFGSRGTNLAEFGSASWRKDVEEATQGGRSLLMAQAFLPAVHKGEKRIFLVNGRPLGALLRIPRPGDFLANPDLGARLEKTSLTMREQRLCAALTPFLRKNGIFFAGVDVIDGRLTEINITSPGMLWEWNEVDEARHEREIVDLFENGVKKR